MILAFSVNGVLEQLRNPLVIFGFVGQAVFMARFVLQWYASERRGESHIPLAFWYISIAGALMLLVYSWMREELVFATAQVLGIVIYVRNLMLIHGHARRLRSGLGSAQPDGPEKAAGAAPATVRALGNQGN